MEPVFTVQFLFGDILITFKASCDEAFEFAEGLLLKIARTCFFLCRVRTYGESILEFL